MRSKSWSPAFGLAILFLCWAVPSARGQTAASASVSGIVRDSTGAILPGVTVDIRNHSTNQVSESVTDGTGRFRILYLPVGDYHLAAQLPGFTTANVNLSLAVGDQIDVPIVMKVAGVSIVDTVAASPEVVEMGRTELASIITPREVDSLPLNGRNYLDLALLAPNVSRTNLRTTDRFAETSAIPGTGVSVAGQRNLNNNFVVDGLSANDDAADLAGMYLSQEVVREFEVVTSGGGAEFGRASSGTVSVVTQSGTNRNGGRAYEFFRNDRFDEQNPLAIRKDPLNQNQFGLTFGGPIVRDRTFWFGNVERSQQDRTGIVTIAPASVIAVNATLDAVGYRGPRITTGNFPTGYTSANGFFRVDHQAAAGPRLQVRYNVYNVTSENARNVGGLGDVSRGTALDDTDQTAAASLLTSRSSGTINELRAQYTHSRLGAPVNDIVGPAVGIAGVANFGTSTSSPTGRDTDVLQAIDTLTIQRGAHLLKAGVDLLYNRINITFPGALQGSYTFTSLANFQRGLYSQYQQAFGMTSLLQSNPNLALFAQDEWRVRRDVTIDAGLRYDLQWLPQPIQLDANNVSPRLGIAYAPGDGRTVYRASGGLYFDRIPLRATSNAIQRDGTKYQTAVLSFGQAGAPVWPAVLPSFPPGVLVSISNINPNVQNQYNRAGGGAGRARPWLRTLGAGRLFLRSRPRHSHVAQRQRADADGSAGRPSGRAEPREAEPCVRQHQPVRRARRRLVQRIDGVARITTRAMGRRSRVLHAVQGGRRCGQRFLPDAADAERHPGGQGAVGQRSASSSRGQRDVRRRFERIAPTGAGSACKSGGSSHTARRSRSTSSPAPTTTTTRP